MTAEQGAALADFARACKAATRAVSLYPGSHPAIQASLSRLVTAAGVLTRTGDALLVVHPGAILIGDRAAVRPDASIGELAALLHGRLVGSLRIHAGVDAEDWRRFLLLVASAVDDLISQGGIAKAWAATGRGHVDIEEIDYAAVLKERTNGDDATWDNVLASCLKGEALELDENVTEMLLTSLADTASFGALLDRLQEKADTDGASVAAQVAALFQLLKAALAAVETRQVPTRDEVLETVAASSPHLSPNMILGLMGQRESAQSENSQLASSILDRMTDQTIASFVARSVTQGRGASARLAQAFEALVPDESRKSGLLAMAYDEAKAGELGQDTNFQGIWQDAARTMLATYSDEGFVTADYARELTAARTQAIEVERSSDDPPERIAEWLGTVSERALCELDHDLTLDLLRIEEDAETWEAIANLAARDIERGVLTSNLAAAQQLADAIAGVAGGERQALHATALRVQARLASSAFSRHVVAQLRKATEADVAAISRLCQTIGPTMVRPLAETLANEEHVHTIRRLRELLISFGAAGRQAVEPLKNASNPAVRRTAIDLLRGFGGNEALHELAAMLSDADPQVQQDSIRAIVQIGTKEAYGTLERACAANTATRDIVVRELVSLRDPKTIPPLCRVLTSNEPTAAVAAQHEAIIEALASLRAHPDSTAALRTALHRGTWWAPVRTSRLRQAAARGLRRLGSDDARQALEEAARTGSRGVRKVAMGELSSMGAGGGQA
jgi:HEAT repeat protein